MLEHIQVFFGSNAHDEQALMASEIIQTRRRESQGQDTAWANPLPRIHSSFNPKYATHHTALPSPSPTLSPS